MESNSTLSEEKVNEHRERFSTSLNICKEVFAANVFMNPTTNRKGLVHYDLMMNSVGELDAKIAREHASEIQKAYLKLCQSNDFRKTSSGGLQNKDSIIRRRNQWDTLLQGVLDAV